MQSWSDITEHLPKLKHLMALKSPHRRIGHGAIYSHRWTAGRHAGSNGLCGSGCVWWSSGTCAGGFGFEGLWSTVRWCTKEWHVGNVWILISTLPLSDSQSQLESGHSCPSGSSTTIPTLAPEAEPSHMHAPGTRCWRVNCTKHFRGWRDTEETSSV